jgi:hypothetical protein
MQGDRLAPPKPERPRPRHAQRSGRSLEARRALLVLVGVALAATPAAHPDERHPPLQLFIDAASPDEREARRALTTLDEWWRDEYACILVDIARFMSPRPTAGMAGRRGSRGIPGRGAPPREDPSMEVRERLVRFLEEQTGQGLGDDLWAWRLWYWNRPYRPHPEYASLKAALYSHVSERMAQLFLTGGPEGIRLDEVDWSGWPVDRIAILDHPKHVPADQAGFLHAKHVVLGVEVDGEARAYPQRILAWHGVTRDRLGGTELTIVTDSLCGTSVPYTSQVGGRQLTFAPSGLIYRSSTLLYDEETLSLWSTIEARAVVGPLLLYDAELRSHPAVMTTWREWRATHPDTTVLSVDTGHERDYSEGAAFRRYYRTDRLLYDVPMPDARLKNKEPVLALVLPPAGGEEPGVRRALAIRASLLEKKQNRVYQTRFAGHELVIVTSPDGAHRVYAAGETRFVAGDRDSRLRDASGGEWRLEEAALRPESADVSPKVRLPARRVFWFAWHAQFPDTELVK